MKIYPVAPAGKFTHHLRTIRILAILFGIVTFLMIPSLITALVLREYSMIRSFLIPPAIGLFLALPATVLIPKTRVALRPRDGFLLVFLTWVFASLVGSLPYYFSPAVPHYIDAIFESTCGFATTGASSFNDVEILPKSLLLWRSISHWAGGMGIIVLTVALMPILGVGGFQLVKAEVPGPEKENITPRVNEASKVLWGVYCIFTLVLLLLYRLGGMEWFDAVCHSFTIMATGGASTKNQGFGFYNSAFLDWVTVVFMLLGALNFNIYYKIVHKRFRDAAQNTEARVYIAIFIIATLLISLSLIPHYGSLHKALRFGSFEAASFLTSTGNSRIDFTAWPALAQAVLFCLMFIGGCSGSTAGGIKVIRHTVLFKQAWNELRRLLYPQGVFSIQLNRKVGRKDVVYGVAGFIFLYFLIIAVTTLITAAAGFSVFSSFCTAVSMIGNIGAGFGIAGPHHNYSAYPGYLKLFYCIVMIAGRLELWTVFVLFTPEYWKR